MGMSIEPLDIEARHEGLAALLNSVTEFRRSRTTTTRKLITHLKNEWVLIREKDRDRNLRENHHFNPLRQITIKETDHSRILGELLHPLRSHGQGDLFLNSFLEILNIEPGGEWDVTIEEGRIDILLRRSEPESVVIIENKARNAIDQRGQLYRYWFDHIHSVYPYLDYENPETFRLFRVVYLPPCDFALPAEISLVRPDVLPYSACENFPRLPSGILDCRSFRGDIANWLNGFKDHAFSPRLRTFIDLYKEIWRLC